MYIYDFAIQINKSLKEREINNPNSKIAVYEFEFLI